jgi:signal transduction histidine kinase
VRAARFFKQSLADAVVVLLVVAAQAEAWLAHVHGSRVSYSLLALLTTAPLQARRRFPFAAPAVVVAGLAFAAVVERHYAGDVVSSVISLVLAAWFAGTFNGRERALVLLGLQYVATAYVVTRDPGVGAGAWLWWNGLASVAWVFGVTLYTRARHAAELEEHVARSEARREAEARAAVAEERARIARELHDVVAHSVSVMTVQAAGVRRLLRPEQTRERGAPRRASRRAAAAARGDGTTRTG